MKGAAITSALAPLLSIALGAQNAPPLPPPGTARLEVLIERAEAAKASAIVSFLVPLDGKEHEFTSGRQIPIQTRINNVITVLYINAATGVEATLTPYTAGGRGIVGMAVRLQNTHVIQQLGIPFSVAEAPLLDKTDCSGTWLMVNGGSRDLCSWSTRGKVRVQWKVSAKLVWDGATVRGTPLDTTTTSSVNATALIATGRSERLQTISCDLLRAAVMQCESRHGRQVPVVTTIEGSKLTTYVDATTNILLAIAADGKTSIIMGDNGLDPPRDITQIDFRQFRSTRGTYEIPASTLRIDGLTVSRFAKSDADEVSVTLQRYRRTSPAIKGQ